MTASRSGTRWRSREYLNELKPDAGLLPADRAARAHCRVDLRRDAFRLHQPALGAADEPQGALSRLQGLGRRAGRHRPHRRDLARMPRRPPCGPLSVRRRSPAWPTPCTRRSATRFLTYDVKLDPKCAAYCKTIMAMPLHAGMDRRRPKPSRTSWKSSTSSSETTNGLARLVSRFRSSHHCAAHSFANFGIKGTLAIYDSSAVFGFEVPTQRAAIMIGTSNPPH